MGSVALVTCAALPEGDEDGARLMSACASAGLTAQWVAWDDPAVDWPAWDLSVVRSTWDYTTRREEFLDWARQVARLANPVDVLTWNSDKSYLRDLAAAGVPVVPTSWARPGEEPVFPDDGEFVVKPVVGAGSVGAGRFSQLQFAAARTHVAGLHERGRSVMVQPYLDRVDTDGEAGLVFLGGQYSHCINKGAMLSGAAELPPDPCAAPFADPFAGPFAAPSRSRSLFVLERITARAASAAQRAVADTVLAHAPADLLYARVDLLPGPDGPVLVELELTEPSLFLGYQDGAAELLAAAIAARVAR